MQLRRHRAGIARKAAAAQALLIRIMAYLVAATFHGKLLPVIRLHRAGLQTRLLDTTQAGVLIQWRSVHALAACGSIIRVHRGQSQGKAVGVPQAVPRVQAQHQGAGKHRLAAARPLLKRVVMRLQWRALKRVERQATKLLRQCIADVPTPAV